MYTYVLFALYLTGTVYKDLVCNQFDDNEYGRTWGW